MQQINDCLSNTNQDWEKRCDSVITLTPNPYPHSLHLLTNQLYFKLKRIRSLAIICQNQYEDEFYASIKLITVSTQLQIKDLRSQIVREACITVAYVF